MTFLFLVFAGLFVVPVALSTVFHFKRDRILDWRNADRSSAGLLPPPVPEVGAVVRIFSARTVRWRGIVATHSWVVVKEAGAAKYSRFDYTAWGEPIWIDRFVPDGRWFGRARVTSSVAMTATATDRAMAILASISRSPALAGGSALVSQPPTPGQSRCR
jgi:hypothetical protein